MPEVVKGNYPQNLLLSRLNWKVVEVPDEKKEMNALIELPL